VRRGHALRLGRRRAYSDGKLTLSTEVGGHLGDFLDDKPLFDLLTEADRIYVSQRRPRQALGDLSPEVEELGEKARLAGLEFIPLADPPHRHGELPRRAGPDA